jgi:hypothetical protein
MHSLPSGLIMRNGNRSATRYLIAVVVSLSALQVGADECSQPNSNGISSGDVLNISGLSTIPFA